MNPLWLLLIVPIVFFAGFLYGTIRTEKMWGLDDYLKRE
jgi:hypothetical protein